jgi:hypothetical protein
VLIKQGQELQKFEKDMLRSKMKAAAKAASMATIRRQREHVLYSVPSDVVAGKDVKVVYNPANTILAGSAEVRRHASGRLPLSTYVMCVWGAV